LSQWISDLDDDLSAAKQLMAFAMCQYMDRGNKSSTVSSKISAVVYFHKLYRGRILNAAHPLLNAMKRGMVREEGEAGLNVTVPRSALTWQQLQAGQRSVKWTEYAGGGAVWHGLMLSYILMARASELFAYDNTGKVHEAYCLRRADLTFMKGEESIPWSGRHAADKVRVNFRASK
jgi:hypothetical protein